MCNTDRYIIPINAKMHESLSSCPANNNTHSGYLKIEEGKNNWIEYWVLIRDKVISLYSDECSEESGEEAIKTIELTSETRCELLQRRNYHFRFKLLVGSNTSYRLKCSSAFHRQQWISHIMLASAKDKDRVIELNTTLNSERDGAHRRTLSTESQLSSDADSLYEAEMGVESNGVQSNGSICSRTVKTPESGPESPTKSAPSDRRGSKGILRRLSFKSSSRLKRDSKSSPKGVSFNDIRSPSPAVTMNRKMESHLGSSASLNSVADGNKVFVNQAFVPSPSASPKTSRQTLQVQECNLIDMSQSNSK